MTYGRKTGGRKPGVPNKKTAALQNRVAESGITPLDYMLNLLRTDETPPALKFEAAKAAAPYIHPKLSNIDVGNAGGKPFEVKLSDSDTKLL
jgi:hypothetical protein